MVITVGKTVVVKAVVAGKTATVVAVDTTVAMVITVGKTVVVSKVVALAPVAMLPA
jgi:hypothetical protein